MAAQAWPLTDRKEVEGFKYGFDAELDRTYFGQLVAKPRYLIPNLIPSLLHDSYLIPQPDICKSLDNESKNMYIHQSALHLKKKKENSNFMAFGFFC